MHSGWGACRALTFNFLSGLTFPLVIHTVALLGLGIVLVTALH